MRKVSWFETHISRRDIILTKHKVIKDENRTNKRRKIKVTQIKCQEKNWRTRPVNLLDIYKNFSLGFECYL